MTPTYYLVLSALLFTIGAVGVLVRRNAIVRVHVRRADAQRGQPVAGHLLPISGNLDGQIIAFFVMVVAAAEVVVGLAIIMSIFRTRRSASRRRREPAEVLDGDPDDGRDCCECWLPATGCSRPSGCSSRCRWPAPRSCCCSAAGVPTGWATCSAARPSIAAFVLGLSASFAAGAAPDDRGRSSVDSVHLDPVGTLHVDFGLLHRPAVADFVLLITGVGSLIHIYSIGYMAHDADRRKFFAYLNLFVAAMLLLVLGEQLRHAVRRLGGRRPGVVPADRLLVRPAGGRDRRQEGVHHEPGR